MKEGKYAAVNLTFIEVIVKPQEFLALPNPGSIAAKCWLTASWKIQQESPAKGTPLDIDMLFLWVSRQTLGNILHA